MFCLKFCFNFSFFFLIICINNVYKNNKLLNMKISNNNICNVKDKLI